MTLHDTPCRSHSAGLGRESEHVCVPLVEVAKAIQCGVAPVRADVDCPKKQLVEQRAEFERGNPKHRYVGVYAPNRRIKRAILKALRWKTFPYPKREPSPQDRVQVVDPDPVPITYAVSVP